jgi:hypothetical protein
VLGKGCCVELHGGRVSIGVSCVIKRGQEEGFPSSGCFFFFSLSCNLSIHYPHSVFLAPSTRSFSIHPPVSDAHPFPALARSAFTCQFLAPAHSRRSPVPSTRPSRTFARSQQSPVVAPCSFSTLPHPRHLLIPCAHTYPAELIPVPWVTSVCYPPLQYRSY